MLDDTAPITELPVLGVSDFVALLNQTLEYAYPSVMVSGELANFRISKNRWVYFDLKDEQASVRCFGTVYQLPGPLEDGMLLQVRAVPRLHQLYGFSLNILSLQPAGAGTIRRAAELLQAKLAAEGLFDVDRKRALPYPPTSIGLVTSGESAAYADFTKILQARWSGVTISHIDVQVQGEAAPAQIVAAIERFNGLAEPPEVLVVIRGGGSADDLAAFSHEQVTRAVAASRVPTLVAIGHEIDTCLAELAADVRASTPSNAAELLVPDKRQIVAGLQAAREQLHGNMGEVLRAARLQSAQAGIMLEQAISQQLKSARQEVTAASQLLAVLSPQAVLQRGYAIVRRSGTVVRQVSDIAVDDSLTLTFSDGTVSVMAKATHKSKE